MRIATALSATLLSVLAQPAVAQTEDEVFAALEAIYGTEQAGNFEAYFEALTEAFDARDLETIANVAAYPFEVAANGELYDILAPEDLVDNFDALLLPETVAAIAAQDYADLIVTDEGVGFADGALWLANICEDEACGIANWWIVRINN